MNLENNKSNERNYSINHDMHLNEEPFNRIKSGEKDTEYRVNDKKRQLVKVGDMITFYKRPEDVEIIKGKVIELNYYPDLLAMYTANFDGYLKNYYSTPQEAVDDSSYYDEEEVKEFGCVAIKIKKIIN